MSPRPRRPHLPLDLTVLRLAWMSLLALSCGLWAAEPGAAPAARPQPPQDDPRLPRVMLIGDSISVGYTDAVRAELAGLANVHRVEGNAGPSSSGVQKVDDWIAPGKGRWDVVHFNFGLHDLKLGTGGKTNQPYPTSDGHQVPLAEYEKNLRTIVGKLKTTGATLIWCATTPVPTGKLDPLRRPGDEVAYNAVALKIMQENGVAVNDLHAFALSQPPGLQQPANVHFTKEGSAILARQVAARIRDALAQRKR
jgi:lysophospholipase L1-like esterase